MQHFVYVSFHTYILLYKFDYSILYSLILYYCCIFLCQYSVLWFILSCSLLLYDCILFSINTIAVDYIFVLLYAVIFFMVKYGCYIKLFILLCIILH